MFQNVKKTNLKKMLGICAIAMGIGFVGLGSTAQAGDSCYGSSCYKPPCYSYKWVIDYRCDYVPYTKCFTYYDHCGKPYTVHKTFYKTVRVPFKRLVKVAY